MIETLSITNVVSYLFVAVVVFAALIMMIYIMTEKVLSYKVVKDIYISTGSEDAIVRSNSYSVLYDFVTSDYTSVKTYKGYFEITLSDVTSANSISFVVRDDNGNDLGDEILITQEKPYKVPFEVENSDSRIHLYYKTTTDMVIIQERIEIYIF